MALSVVLVCLGALHMRTIPVWLSGLGLIAAALLLGLFLPTMCTIGTMGIAIKVPVALAVSTLSIWMLAFAIWSVFSKQSVRTIQV